MAVADMPHPSLRRLALLLVALTAPGCSRVADVAYTLRADAEKLDLPAKHKAQIAEYLAMFHGTPTNPRMALADPAAALPATEQTTAAVAAIPRIDKPGYDRRTLQLGHSCLHGSVRRLPRHDGGRQGTRGRPPQPSAPRLPQWRLQVHVDAAGLEAPP